MAKNKTEHRIRYADTDHFGVVYYARYLDWFEAGRTEILREKGVTYADLEKKGIYAPVVEIKVNYKAPGRYDEIIVLETEITKIGNTSIRFDYKVFNKKSMKLLAEAYTVNVFIDKGMKPVPVPEDIKKLV
ncbi:acyl-CoA thioesterase [Candidatus Woesearchaeota archaeon]|nr:acyl-CoA thioesterase [Candidatus Woesearchaeota archaeon]